MAADGSLDAALAAGWQAEEWEWETAQEQAAQLAANGQAAEAEHCWNTALETAKQHFPADDLRLGTSLANCGFYLVRKGMNGDAHLRPAKTIWDASPLWIDRAALKPAGRSSSHHFRMAVKNRGVYEAQAKRLLQDAAAKARAVVSGNLAADAREQLELWRREKQSAFDEKRKILSACLLLVSG